MQYIYTGIYADWAAAAPLHPAARDELLRWFGTPSNPSSLHSCGMTASGALESARSSLAQSFGWNGGVTFTSGGTESIGLAVHSLVRRCQGTNRRRIVLSPLEHPAVREAVRAFALPAGMQSETCAVTPDGTVDPADFALRMGEDVAFAAVMTVQNETGVIQPVEKLADLAHGCGALFLTDAVQAAGHIGIPACADMAAVSAHKFGGPAGVGALLHHGGLVPLLKGGGQERGLRGGTENVPGICAMAAAAKAVCAPEWMADARDRLEAAFLCRMEAAGVPVSIAGCGADRIGTVTCAVFGGAESENLVLSCDLAGLAVSAGSACHSGTRAPSGVLLAMGYTEKEAMGGVRLSFGYGTAAAEMEEAYRILGDAAEKLCVFG